MTQASRHIPCLSIHQF